MILIRKILFPFAAIYGFITGLRNWFYDIGIFKSAVFDVPVVAVGNLSVGGTGKSPQIEYLLRLLIPNHKVATLSRGYKRKSKGFVLADENSDAQILGDEPFQFHRKFPEVAVAVDADRVNGITKLLELEKPDVILLDDAFQHRKVKAGFYILLTTFHELYIDDFLLPTGNLRESKRGAKRADIIVVTKCPKDLSHQQQNAIRMKMRLESHQQLFFSFIDYDDFVFSDTDEIHVDEIRNKKKVLIAGIAKPKPFFEHLKSKDDVILEFPDHHHFSESETSEIAKKANGNPIVTTEKDYVRLQDSQLKNLYYLPIKSTLIAEADQFDQKILDYVGKVQQTVEFIKSKIDISPEYGVILGSGLGGFTQDIDIEYTLPYRKIPNFPVSTVQGHKGALVFGTIGGKKVVAMQGRFHFYEGYAMQQVTFPVRVMKYLGVNKLIVSNASGGVNPNYDVGDIVIINDHINMMPEHPLRGKNDERFGPRFLNMGEPYSKKLISKAKAIASELGIEVKDGVYMSLQGPTFETLAEYRMVKILGADCVGMSTVPEVIAARHMDMDVFGVSVITDIGHEDSIAEVNHDEVLQAAAKAEPKVRALIKAFIERA